MGREQDYAGGWPERVRGYQESPAITERQRQFDIDTRHGVTYDDWADDGLDLGMEKLAAEARAELDRVYSRESEIRLIFTN